MFEFKLMTLFEARLSLTTPPLVFFFEINPQSGTYLHGASLGIVLSK